MRDLINRISNLQRISESLEPTEVQRQAYINKASQFAHDFLNTLNKVETYNGDHPNSMSFTIDGVPSEMDDLVEIYKNQVANVGMKPASGGHMGYIPGGGLFTSSLADFMVDITNEYAGMYYASPGGVTLENMLIDWMKELFGFSKEAIGNLASGGSISNLIALTAARDKYGIKNEQITKSVIYLSPQVHHCIQKALRIIGLEDVIINYVALDQNSKIDVLDLQGRIESDKSQGLKPFLVIASAGTTDTGAIDPLEAIGNIAKKHDLWYHIDGAYGGFFMLVDSIKHKLKGIEMADSLVVDPHKGLFIPYGVGAVLVKDKEAVYHSNHYRANYMQDAIKDSLLVNPADVSPELTKHFRGLRMWLPIKLHGLEAFKACLEEKLLLTEYFRQRLLDIGFKIGPQPDLSVSYFWYATNNEQENAFNEKLMEVIHEDGEIFLSSTRIDGKFVIRIAILSFRTKLESVDRAIAMINRSLQKVRTINGFQ